MIWLTWLAYLLLLIVMIAGLVINLLSLPGLWLMVIAVLGYAWLTHWALVGWKVLAALVVLGIIAEVVELLAGSAGARAAGASRRASIGAIVGALIGAMVGSAVLFLVGTIIGAILGAFIGAASMELLIGRPLDQSVKSGVGAAKGRFWGLLIKSLIGVAMMVVAVVAAFPR